MTKNLESNFLRTPVAHVHRAVSGNLWRPGGPHASLDPAGLADLVRNSRLGKSAHRTANGARHAAQSVHRSSAKRLLALFWIFLGSAVSLTVGFLTRLNSVVVFLCLASIQQRNLYITHGGDTFLRLAGFFLIFAPAGADLSVDRLICVRRGKQDPATQPWSPWAQRMIQFELALMYFATFCWKAQGTPWIEGTALGYVYHLDELRRFPLPGWFLHPLFLKAGTWCALALEFSLGVLIWIQEFRYYLLAAGVLFHLLIEYSLNIPMFEWDVLSAYVLFIEPEDLTWAWERTDATLRRLERRTSGGNQK